MPGKWQDKNSDFCATVGGRPVCSASSAIRCKRGIGITVKMHPDFKDEAIKLAVYAALIVHCLELGVEPHWHAHVFRVPHDLAEKLGYVQKDVCEMLRPY